ncbi:MAG: acylphosphatase [Candidatus Acidiferrales bacterium]
MSAELQAKRFYVCGMVQGVGFRYFARRLAARVGVGGYVRNLMDGRVEVYAVGSDEQLRSLAAELERGPISASVERVEEEAADVVDKYAEWFAIEHGA